MPNPEQQYNPLVQGSFTTYEAPINNFEQPNALSSMELDIKTKIELADASKFSGLKANETKMLQNVFGAEKASWTNYDVTVGEAYRKIGDKYYTKYDDPNLGFIAGMDNEERYGRAQSSASKWGNGLVKLFGKTSTAVLGGTIGTITGAFNAIQQGSMSALYTDSFNQMLDDLNEKMDYKLPNYYTRQEQNKSLLGQMGTANFWANDVLGGLTFTLGMVVSEGIWAYATGGMSLASAPVRWGAKTLGLSRAQKALGTYKAIGKKTLNSAVTKQALDTARTASTRASKTKDLLNQARFLYTSAGYEGGVEARHYMKETEEVWANNFRQTMGRDPNSQEFLEFRRGLTSSANAVFIGNVGLVGATNLAVFGRTLLGAKSTAKFKNNWFKNKVLGVGFEKTDDMVRAIKATRSQKIRSNVYDVLKPVFLEGFVEEGGQGVMSKAAEAYTMSAYDPTSTIENMDMLDALWEGFKETYGTKEGQKEVLIGAIIGIFGGGMSGSFNQSARERKAIEDVSKYYNSFTAKNLLNNNIYTSRVKSATSLVDKATSEGDKVGGAIGERMGTVAKIERDYAFGGVKEGAEDYKAYMYSSIEQIKEDLGLDQESAVEWIEEKASEYSKLADEYVKNREFSEAFIGSNDVAEFKNANISTDAVRRALALYLTIGKEADVLASNTIRDIQDIVANKLGNPEVVRAMGITEGLRRANNNAYRSYYEANKKLKGLEEQYNKLRDRLAQIDSTREQNEAEASERAKIVKRFEELKNKIQEEQLNKQAAYSALNLKDVTDQTITMEDLDNQDKNLKTLQDAIEGLRKSDPSEYQAINDLLREYKTAITYAKSFKDVADKMISADTKTTEITGWLTKLFSKNEKLEEGEQAWFVNLVMNYQKDKIADVLHSDPTIAEEVDPKEKIDTITPKAEEARGQEIKDLAQKIANGETNLTPAELQLQIDNPQELKRELSRIRQEREPLDALKKQKAQKQQELENLKNNTSAPIEVVPESDAVEGQYFVRDLFGEQEAQPSTTLTDATNLNVGDKIAAPSERGIRVLTIKEINENIGSIEQIITEEGVTLTNPGRLTGGEMSWSLAKVEQGSVSNSTPTDVAVYRKTAEGATMVSGVIAEKIKKGEFTVSENNEEAIKQVESEIEQLDKEIENYNKPPERQSVVKLAEQIIKIEKKISDLIQGNSYTRVFRGDNPTELIKSKPSQEDVNRYKELLKKVSQSSLDTLRLTQNFSVLKEDGLTEAEIGEFRELNSKLGDWSVLDGVSEEGNSVADLLLLLEQYQTQLDQINTKTEYTQKDYLEVKTAPEREASSSETANPMQSPDTVKVQIYNGKYEISHIELTSLATAMGGTLAEKNKDGSTKEVESETTKEKGRVFILTVSDKSVEITIGDHARLIINKKELDEILPNTPLKIVDYGSKKNYDLYEKVDGNFIPLRGDFKYGERELDIEALNQLQKTDKVSLEVDINDPYNKNLLKKYKRAKSEKKKKELLKEIKESLHIYVVVGGRIVGSLRAISGVNLSNNSQTQKLLEMRELAMNYIESGGVIPVEIPVKQSFIGSPNYVITEDSNSPTTIPFTTESAKQVISAGYYEKGKLKLDKNIEAETMFLKTLSGRVPVIVFNYNGRNIAFPVSLVKESIDMSSRLDPIMSMDISQSEQIRLINEVLIEFGISPAEYVLDPTNPLLEGDNLIVLKAIQERMSNIETFADLEMWVNGNYNLVGEAQIAIDITNNPFSANKVILDLSNLSIEDTDAKLIEIFTGKVELAESLRKELANTYNTLYDSILNFLTTGYRVSGISVTQAEKEIPSQVRNIIDADNGVDTSVAVGYAQEIGKLRGLKKSLLNAKGGIRPFGVKFLEYLGIKLEDIVSKIGQYDSLESELTALKIDISDPNVMESVKKEVSKMNCKI